jgi:hypothetical protein
MHVEIAEKANRPKQPVRRGATMNNWAAQVAEACA